MKTKTKQTKTTRAKAKQAKAKRKILTILSNRFSRSQRPLFLELDCTPDGAITQERKLRSQPRQAIYDEVWENDEGKTSLSSCTSMKRKYRHPLEKPRRA